MAREGLGPSAGLRASLRLKSGGRAGPGGVAVIAIRATPPPALLPVCRSGLRRDGLRRCCAGPVCCRAAPVRAWLRRDGAAEHRPERGTFRAGAFQVLRPRSGPGRAGLFVCGPALPAALRVLPPVRLRSWSWSGPALLRLLLRSWSGLRYHVGISTGAGVRARYVPGAAADAPSRACA